MAVIYGCKYGKAGFFICRAVNSSDDIYIGICICNLSYNVTHVAVAAMNYYICHNNPP